MKRSRALLACPVIRYKFILDFAACYYYFQHSCKSFICKYIGLLTDHWFHSRFHFFISVFPVLCIPRLEFLAIVESSCNLLVQ